MLQQKKARSVAGSTHAFNANNSRKVSTSERSTAGNTFGHMLLSMLCIHISAYTQRYIYIYIHTYLYI